MNHYKIHFALQAIVVIACIIIAITVDGGGGVVAVIQAFMGIYQTIIAVVLFVNYNEYPIAIQKQLSVYSKVWVFNALFVIAFFVWLSSFPHESIIIYGVILFFAIPWSSVLYFMSIQRKIYQWKDGEIAQRRLHQK